MGQIFGPFRHLNLHFPFFSFSPFLPSFATVKQKSKGGHGLYEYEAVPARRSKPKKKLAYIFIALILTIDSHDSIIDALTHTHTLTVAWRKAFFYFYE